MIFSTFVILVLEAFQKAGANIRKVILKMKIVIMLKAHNHYFVKANRYIEKLSFLLRLNT